MIWNHNSFLKTVESVKEGDKDAKIRRIKQTFDLMIMTEISLLQKKETLHANM